MVYFDQIIFGFAAEKAEAKVWDSRQGEAKVRDSRQGEAWPMEREQSEDGTPNRTGIVRLIYDSILRSRRRRNSGGSEGSVQNLSSGYGSTFHHRPISYL